MEVCGTGSGGGKVSRGGTYNPSLGNSEVRVRGRSCDDGRCQGGEEKSGVELHVEWCRKELSGSKV